MGVLASDGETIWEADSRLESFFINLLSREIPRRQSFRQTPDRRTRQKSERESFEFMREEKREFIN